MKNKFIFGACLLSILSFLPGCNTFEGAGKDIEGAGEKLKDTASDTKEAITHHH